MRTKRSLGQRPGNLGLRVFVFVIFVALRVWALNADPPSWLSWSTGVYTDEGFYTLDARHLAHFGQFAPGDFHDRWLAPALSGLQWAVFRVFGDSVIAARSISVVFGLGTVLVLWLGLRRVCNTQVADLSALLLGLAPPFVCYNRLALQETPAVFWLTLGFCFWAYGATSQSPKARCIYFVLSGAVSAFAVLWKSLAFLGLPALIWMALTQANRRERACILVGIGSVLCAFWIAWLLPHQSDIARLTSYYRVHQMQPHSVGALWGNLKRAVIGGERGVLPYLIATMIVPCALVLWWIIDRKREIGSASKYFAIWLISGLAFCFVSSYAPSRYYVLFLPALSGLAAIQTQRLTPSVRLGMIGLWSVLTICFVCLTPKMVSMQVARTRLVQTLPAGSVVAGEFAPSLCLGTSFRALPVQPGLSNSTLPQGVSAVLVTQTPFWTEWWSTHYPNIVNRPPSTVFELGGRRQYRVELFDAH